MCTIHKKKVLLQLNNNDNNKNLTEKWKSTWIDFYKEDINGQKYMKRSSFTIMEMQIKSTQT